MWVRVPQVITGSCCCASEMCMTRLIKQFLCVGGLVLSLQSAWGFALLGPTANGPDSWQVAPIGYSLINTLIITPGGPVFLQDLGSPKNLAEEYRRNAPVFYYAFDSSFADYFGTNGMAAVDGAFAIMNSISNVDNYSTGLSEFPLESQQFNYTAQALGLTDVKSETLHLLVEQLGLSQPERFTWTLRQRNTLPNLSCPLMEYLVVQRNFDIIASPLNVLQYSPYVNGTLYSYYINEICTGPNPLAVTVPFPVDPLNAPVYSTVAANTTDGLQLGGFYTGLTRDDVAGLRYLLSSTNINYETAAAGSTLFNTNFNFPQLLFTSNYNALVTAAMTNNPAALQALYPGLQFDLLTNYFSNVVVQTENFVTNFPIGGIAGQGYVGLQTTYSTNLQEFFQYAFDNVAIHSNYFQTTYALQTITVGSPIGSPVGSPFATNVTYQAFQSNIPSGDFFIISNGACGPNIIETLQTNVNVVTNTLSGVTNADGSSIVQNLISYFTNYAFEVQPCTLVSNAVGLYQGIERVQFVRRDFDSLLGQFWTPITNRYTMVLITNNQLVVQGFERVVTTPDFVFTAGDLADAGGGNGGIGFNDTVSRTPMNFVQDPASVVSNAGPGIINSPTVFEFNKVGPIYWNSQEFSFIPNEQSGIPLLIWASFDGTTNAPVVYPNGTSIANLESQIFMQVSPLTLPNGTNGVAYNVSLSVTGGTAPYTWGLATNSAGLPPGLSLSGNGIISGTNTQSGTFDGIVVQVTDFGARSVNMIYSMTVNP